MGKSFKGVLCLATRPQAWSRYHHMCKRHGGHSGPHRVCYGDGMAAVWNTGDQDAEILPVKEARKRK